MWQRHGWKLFVVLWVGLIVAGMGALVRYSLVETAQGEPPARWHFATPEYAGKYVLVMAVHPRCPCTRAALSELETLMAHSQGRLRARLLFVQPSDRSAEWTMGPLWREARAIPAVETVDDVGGREADRLGALSSSEAALYDPSGALRFHGGITGARGFTGPNPGEQAVLAVLHGDAERLRRSAVYGCSLQGPHTPCRAR